MVQLLHEFYSSHMRASVAFWYRFVSVCNEKEPGEWNKYETTFDGGEITLIVNGKKVSEVAGCDVRAEKIRSQSEGGEIHFRTVTLTPLQ